MKKLLICALSCWLGLACDDDPASNNANNANNVNNVNNANNVNNVNNANNVNNPGPCDADPCATAGLHRGTCVELAAEPGYECRCDPGFSDTGAGCELEVWETCPTDTFCTGDVCVPPAEAGAQCVADLDCHENLSAAEGNPTFCNEAPLGGICTGCREGSPADCPSGFTCNPFGTCGVPCGDPSDCLFGECAMGVGFCTAPWCASDLDCVHGTLCVDPDGDGTGLCTRVPCVDTLCSPYNPQGACDPGASCIDGACFDSCEPNPCTGINRGACTLTPDGPVCDCDPGYLEDEHGACVPDPLAGCPTGFSCRDGYCVDPAIPFQCVLDGDCGGAMTCSPTLPTGTCRGCTGNNDCPAGFGRCLAGYCLRACNAGTPCPEGMTCTSGYCGRKLCADAADCLPGYTCVVQGDGTSSCERFTCVP